MTPQEIDDWLIANHHDREWLAQQLGYSTGSIYNSFSKGFSKRTQAAIRKIIGSLDTPTAGLEVTFTADEFERIEEARKLIGTPTRKLFYEQAITEFTDDILAREQNEQTFSSLIPAATATTDPCADPAASTSRIPLTSRQQTKPANIVPLPPQHVVAHHGHGLNETPGPSTAPQTNPQPAHYEPAKKHRRKS